MMTRHFLTMTDLRQPELQALLREAARVKRRRATGSRARAGKTVALVFQKPSMRTRAAFEVAVAQLGGSVIYMGQDDIQLGTREPMKDVARVLSGYVDAIVLRTFAHPNVEEFAGYAACPVINGLSDLAHPCQALADLFTIQEEYGRVKGVRIAFVGDGNNVLHSLAEGAAMLGGHVVASTPSGHRPDAAIWKAAARRAKTHGGSISWEADPAEAVRGADVVYTDVWTSMGQERERAKRLKAFRSHQVNRALLKHAKPRCRVMHCLPAHRGEEISEDVMEGSQSIIFAQAENRLHSHKALLMMLLGGYG